jgi:fumarate reductase subunit D
MSKSNEVLWWSLFSAGGVMAALAMPALILSTGFLLGTNDTSMAAERYVQLQSVLSWWIVRLALFVVISLSFFHCAHRIRHTLMDLGVRGVSLLLMMICYGGALAGTIASAVIMVRL